MTQKTNILVTGTHSEILSTIVRLLHKVDGWQAISAISFQEVESLCTDWKFDILLLGAGTDATTEKDMIAIVKRFNPQLKVVHHFGGGSGLLYAEIYLALAT